MQTFCVALPFKNKSHCLLALQYATSKLQFIRSSHLEKDINMQVYQKCNTFLFKILLSSAF